MWHSTPRRSACRSWCGRLWIVFAWALHSGLGAATFTAGNILVNQAHVSGPYFVYEYTPGGSLVQTIEIPWPGTTPPGPGDTPPHDLVIDGAGLLHLFNGSFTPYLSTYNPGTETWNHYTASGWGATAGIGSGGIASFGDFIYVTDYLPVGGVTSGLLRFDAADGYSAMRFGITMEFEQLTIGHDGLLYALGPGGSPSHYRIDVYDPMSRVHLRTVQLPVSVGAIAVDQRGHIFGSGWTTDPNIYEMSPTGTILKQLQAPFNYLTDLNLDESGRIVVGADDQILTTDSNLVGYYTFATTGRPGSLGSYVAWVAPPPGHLTPDCVPAPSGLVGWWPGDGGVNDLVSGRLGALLSGMSADAAGQAGASFRCDGNDDWAWVSDAPELRPSSLTLEAWVNPTALGGWRTIAFKGANGGLGYVLYADDNGSHPAGHVFINGNEWAVFDSQPLALNAWSHLAMTYDGSVLALYVNGGMVAYGSLSGPIAASSDAFSIGGNSVWGEHFQGRIDEVSLYDRALSPAEVAALHAAGAAGKCKGPLITLQPGSLSVLKGSNAVFEAAAEGVGPLSFRWRKDGVGLSDGGRISGATSPLLTIQDVQAADAGDYSLNVGNAYRSASSAAASLSVLLPPSLTLQPADQSVLVTSNVSFTTAVAGTSPLSHQWQKNGQDISDTGRITGAATGTLSITGLQTNDAGEYRLIVTNSYGVVTSEVARLTVLLPTLFVLSPTNQTWIAGSNGALHSLATGSEPITFQWYRGATVLIDDARVMGSTGDSLTVSNVQPGDAGTYKVVAMGPGGIATCQPTVVSVVVLPYVSIPPADHTVLAGTNVTLLVSAGGTAPLVYQWRFNEMPIPQGASTSLLLTNVQADDAGGYDVVVTNAYGAVTSVVAALTVVPSAPALAVEPRSQVASIGQDVLLSASAWGTDPIFYQWQRDGMDLPGENGAALSLVSVNGIQRAAYRVLASNKVGMAVSSNAVLSVVPVVVWGRTNYGVADIPASATGLVAIASAQSSGSRSEILAVRSDGTIEDWGSGYKDVVPPGATNIVAVAAGYDARAPAHKLAVRSDGSVVAWGQNYLGEVIVPANATNAVAVAAGEYHSLALRGDGSVVAWGDNSYGQVTVPASASNVIAIAAGVRHSLALRADGRVIGWGWNSVGQVSVLSNAIGIMSIAAGGNQSLALHADGSLSGVVITNVLFNQQSIYGAPPTNLHGVKAIAGGGRNSLYLLGDTTVAVEGWNSNGEKVPPSYATNVTAIAAGNYHGMALVRDEFAPVVPYVGHEPIGRSVLAGESFVIHALALGSLPLSHQWKKGGVPVHGQTNPWLYLTNVHPRDGGDYVMVASNEFGSVTSAVATVTVAVPEPVLNPQGMTTNGFSFTFESIDDVLYVTEHSESISSGPWTELERRFGSGGTETVTDPEAGAATRFYRVWAVFAPSPKLGSATWTGSEVSFSVPTVAGARYVVEYKDGLEAPSWMELEERLGTGEVLEINDPGPLPASRFYRVRVEWVFDNPDLSCTGRH